MLCEEGMNYWHGGETPREEPPLKFKGLGHNPLIIWQLGICVHLKLALNTPPIGLVGN